MKQKFDEIDEALTKRDLDGAQTLHESLPDGQRRKSRALVLSARLALAQSEPEKALSFIRQALKQHGPSQALLRLRALALHDLGDTVRYRNALKELKDESGSGFAQRGLAFLELKEHRPRKARNLAEAALKEDPTRGWAYRCLVGCLNLQDAGDSEYIEVLDRAAAHCDAMPRSWRQILYPADTQTDQDRVARIVGKWPDQLRFANGALITLDDRKSASDAGKDNPDADDRTDDVERFLRVLPPDEKLQRPVITDDGSDMIISEPGPSGTGIVFFSGLANRYGLDVESMDRFIAAAGHRAIYLRDRYRCMFLKGISGIPDGMQGLEARLRTLKAELGLTRLMVIGSSSGGFAALKYGTAIEADGIRCFGGPTTVDAEVLGDLGDLRGRALTRRLLRDFTAKQLDAVRDVANAKGAVPVQMYYGAGMPQDSAHAERLRGVHGVKLAAIPDYDRHDILFHLIVGQRIGEVLTTDFSGAA